jgi:hypothetical protein
MQPPSALTSGRAGRFFAALSWCLLCAAPALAQGSIEKRTLTILLGETAVRVNVHEQEGARVTFFAPHYNERAAAEAARAAVAQRGGRLIEIVSSDEGGRPARRLRFKLGGRSHSVDPNRIFTENGRRCDGVSPAAQPAVEAFAGALLDIIFAAGGERLRDGESFVVAVHNNADYDEKKGPERAFDLTATAFVKTGAATIRSHGAFQEQAAGVYLSNQETDVDNFVFLSSPHLLAPFAERGFNVVVQKPSESLQEKRCGVDDGSLSVYSSLRNIPYVCLEADARTGSGRQREMLEVVYSLVPKAVSGATEAASAGSGQPAQAN